MSIPRERAVQPVPPPLSINQQIRRPGQNRRTTFRVLFSTVRSLRNRCRYTIHIVCTFPWSISASRDSWRQKPKYHIAVFHNNLRICDIPRSAPPTTTQSSWYFARAILRTVIGVLGCRHCTTSQWHNRDSLNAKKKNLKLMTVLCV